MTFREFFILNESLPLPPKGKVLSQPQTIDYVIQALKECFPDGKVDFSKFDNNTIELFTPTHELYCAVYEGFNGVPLVDLGFDWRREMKDNIAKTQSDKEDAWLVQKNYSREGGVFARGLKEFIYKLAHIGIKFHYTPVRSKNNVQRRDDKYSSIISKVGFVRDNDPDYESDEQPWKPHWM